MSDFSFIFIFVLIEIPLNIYYMEYLKVKRHLVLFYILIIKILLKKNINHLLR
jgi:hypothetical protein